MRAFVLSLLFTTMLPATAFAQPAPGRDLVRMGLFTDDPSLTSSILLERLKTSGASQASSRPFGEMSPEGFVFDAYIKVDQLPVLLSGYPGRIAVVTEKDPSADFRRAPADHVRVVMSVTHEPPPSKRSDVRIYQTSSDPKAVANELKSKVGALGLNSKLQPIRTPKDLGVELRMTASRSQLNSVLDLARQQGPFEIRFESPPNSTATQLSIRYVLDSRSQVQPLAIEANGWVYTFGLSSLDRTAGGPQAELVRKKLESLQAKKAGKVDLGTLVDGQPYFHFAINESQLSELATYFATLGTLKVERRPHPRVMPEGAARVILEWRSVLPDPSGNEPSIQAPTKALPTVTVAPPPTPTPILRERPERMSIEFERDASLAVHLDDRSPKQTYLRDLPIKGFAKEGLKLEAQDPEKIEIPVSENGQFVWTLADLEKGQENTRTLGILGSTKKSAPSSSVYRHPRFHLQAAGGLLPVATGGMVFHTMLSGRMWFDELIPSDRQPWQFQRFGLGAHVFMVLKNKELSVLDTVELVDLKYRLSPGLQERDDTFQVMLALQRLHFGNEIANFAGFGLGGQVKLPYFLDMLVNWIPLFDFPKRIDFDAYYFPVVMRAGTNANVNYNFQVLVEPKMFFTSRFSIFGRLQVQSAKYVANYEEISAAAAVAVAGFGYLF